MKILVVTTSGSSGIVPPILKKIEQTYGEIVFINEWLPMYKKLYYRLISFQFSRGRWYRKWSHLCEKTPAAFRQRTKQVNKKIEGLEYDFIIQFEKGLDLYFNKKWDQAITSFKKAQQIKKDSSSDTFINRCKEFQKNPPPTKWDGVWTMSSK